MNSNINLAVWNIKQGGFKSYDQAELRPSREPHIDSVIADLHGNQDVAALSLIDTYRWESYYGKEQGIADHLGYKQARSIKLEDATGDNQMKSIGLTFATDLPISRSWQLDLGNRNGLGIVLDVGKYGLQIAQVYLDHELEETRLKQAKGLLASIETDMPTLIVGDFNSLRLTAQGARLQSKVGDIALRTLAPMLPARSSIGRAIKNLNKRQVVPLLETHNFYDADVMKQPTFPARFPVVGVDYVFHNDMVSVKDVKIVPVQGASDHRAILCKAAI